MAFESVSGDASIDSDKDAASGDESESKDASEDPSDTGKVVHNGRKSEDRTPLEEDGRKAFDTHLEMAD